MDVKGEKLKIMGKLASGDEQSRVPDGSSGKNGPRPGEQLARSSNEGQFLGFAAADKSVIEVMQGILTMQSA